MASCPNCARPAALARAACLYCGASLEPAAPPVPAPEPSAATSGGQALVCVDAASGGEAGLAALLGLTAFEASQRARRGGWQLLRRLPSADAEREAARLSAGGLRALAIPEAEAAVTPWRATGGRWEGDALVLHGEGRERVVRGVDLLLVVTGTITREYQTGESVRRVRAATLTPGLRYHLHMHALAASPELDPDGFDFQGGEEAASAWLRLRAWVERVARGVRRDEGFRWLTPALAPAPRAPLAQALGSGAARGRESLLLDNLAQFRAYSGWRSALERRLSRR